jgi:transposase InsO family protein
LDIIFVLKIWTDGLILHSDMCQGVSKEIGKSGILASVSCYGNCYDNAPMESLLGSLKNELIHQTQYKTRKVAHDARF